MNKELREEMEFLITCDDKAITPDVKDDVKMTLNYIDELEQRINKALKLLDSYKLGKYDYALTCAGLLEFEDILKGENNE